MRNVGEQINRKGTKAVAKLSDTVQGMMSKWTEDNFPIYVEMMELIREKAPLQWLRLYQESVKMGIVKQTDINVTISRQKDREDLQALVRSRIPLPERGEYVPYEEIRSGAEHVPMIGGREEEER